MMKINNITTVTAIVFFTVIAFICVCFMANQSTVTSGKSPEPTESQSLSCKSHDIKYPYFTENSNSVETNINVIFDNDLINSISLVYQVYYSDIFSIERSEAVNHAAINKNFYEDNLDPDALSATYTKSDEYLQFNIYADRSNFNSSIKKYFLLDKIDDEPNFESVKDFYLNNGFACQSTERK